MERFKGFVHAYVATHFEEALETDNRRILPLVCDTWINFRLARTLSTGSVVLAQLYTFVPFFQDSAKLLELAGQAQISI